MLPRITSERRERVKASADVLYATLCNAHIILDLYIHFWFVVFMRLVHHWEIKVVHRS